MFISTHSHVHCQAIYDFTSTEEDELSFQSGDILYVLDWADKDWWRARCKGRQVWNVWKPLRLRYSSYTFNMNHSIVVLYQTMEKVYISAILNFL